MCGHVRWGWRGPRVWEEDGVMTLTMRLAKAQYQYWREKLEKLDQALDRIRQKYGHDAIVRGSFLDKK